MARISNYKLDVNVTKDDKLIGSDSAGGTKTYTLKEVSKFFKNTNAAGIAGQFAYKFDTNKLDGNMDTTFSTGSTFANLTTVQVSKFTYGAVNSSENLLATLESKDILIVDVEDQNNFGVYTAGKPTQDSTHTNFYNISLSAPKSNNGSLTSNKFYAIIVFGGGAGEDKHEAFEDYYEQSDAANPWVVTHGLAKYPSVTVINRNNVEVQAQVTHNSNNQVTITFSGDTAGKAYFN